MNNLIILNMTLLIITYCCFSYSQLLIFIYYGKVIKRQQSLPGIVPTLTRLIDCRFNIFIREERRFLLPRHRLFANWKGLRFQTAP